MAIWRLFLGKAPAVRSFSGAGVLRGLLIAQFLTKRSTPIDLVPSIDRIQELGSRGAMDENWRTKGLALLPELASDFLDEEITPYLSLSEVKNRAHAALKRNQSDLANRCFAFAEWCLNQPDKDVWNAAGTCFYEYIFDNDALTSEVKAYIKKEIFQDIEGLLQLKYDSSKFDRIWREFNSEVDSQQEN